MAGTELRTGVLVLGLLLAPSPGAAVVLTGEVQSIDAQPIFTPQSNSSPVVLRYFVPEGERVEAGQVVLRIDPAGSAGQVRQLEAQREQAELRMAKELAELRVKAVDAELALADAEAAHAGAKIDAAIPSGLVSALDYDRYQGELERTRHELALKQKELTAARAAVERRQGDGVLEIDKLTLQRDYHDARVRMSEVRAEQAGVVVHGFNNNWIGGRIDEGSSTFPGSKAGEVVRGGAMRVQAWALEPDRHGLSVGQEAQLAFDGLPGRRAIGRITAISGAPEARPEWGDGRYFTIDIAMSGHEELKLLPGMSVRVGLDTGGPTK